MIELEGTREKLDKEKIAFKMVSFLKQNKSQFLFLSKSVWIWKITSSIFFVV